MAKLLNIKLRTNKTSYNSTSPSNRVIKLVGQAEITDQSGTKLAQIKNRGGGDADIEVTIKNVKYDEAVGLHGTRNFLAMGSGSAPLNVLELEKDQDFQVESFKDSGGNIRHNLFSAIELSGGLPDVKKIVIDQSDKKNESELVDTLAKIKKYKTATPGSLENKFYELKDIITDDREVKEKIVDPLVKLIEEIIPEYKKVGVGFSVSRAEKYEYTKDSLGAAMIEKGERYTKDNIDKFRKFFTNDLDKDDPKYFREQKKSTGIEIKEGEDYTRTYYELVFWKSVGITVPKIKEIILDSEVSFNETLDKSKKEHLYAYKKVIEIEFPTVKNDQTLLDSYQELTKLFSVLDKASYTSESKSTCENDLSILKKYESPTANSDQEKIKKKFATEISQKKQEINNRLAVLNSGSNLQAAITAAINEDYGQGQLSDERKKIFTDHKASITTEAILTEIKELIKLLVRAEENMDTGTSKDLLNKLKNEYQNDSGDKKTAYTIVNQ
ncbi:4126_t:CDS:2, partial [Racocetra persica]